MTKNQSSDKNKNDGDKKKRSLSLTPLILLLLLLLFILSFLFYMGNKSWNQKNGDGSGNGGGSGTADTSEINSKRIADSLRLDSINQAEAEKRRDDSLSLALAADSARLAALRAASSPRAADSLRRLADSIRQINLKLADSIRQAESKRADSILQAELKRQADSAHIADSINSAAESLRLALAADSIRRAHIADSLANLAADSAALRAAICARDTLVPWVYADPSGGLHRKAVSVKLVANKVCRVEWSFDGIKDWKVYKDKPIDISKNATIYYRAVDSCGKRMDVRSKRYVFDMAPPRCPAGMELVKADGKEICVDVYEWPNKKGVTPQAYVSLYQAMDSCFSMRKRLCTTDEWTSACGGPEHWKYAYGDSYEWNTCATRDTAVQRSGGKPECRSYFGIFDMSGNLAEWTSTQAPQDKSFNNVMGGFWTSGNQSRCADIRYSYFPQNRHNPVGFRCCVDAPPASGGGR